MIGTWLGAKALRSFGSYLGLGKTQKDVYLGNKSGHGGEAPASPETSLNATFADEAYVAPSARRKRIGDYYYDSGISNDENAIYVNKTGRVIHSIRGTEVSRGVGQALKDIGGTWGAIATGNFEDTARHKRNDAKTQEVMRRYGQNIFYVGHSLGGSSSYALANKYNKKSQTFNLGHGLSSSKEIEYAKGCKKDPSQPRCQQIHSRAGFDLVSATPTLVGKTERIKGAGFGRFLTNHELSWFGGNYNKNKYKEDKPTAKPQVGAKEGVPNVYASNQKAPPAPKKTIKKYRSGRF